MQVEYKLYDQEEINNSSFHVLNYDELQLLQKYKEHIQNSDTQGLEEFLLKADFSTPKQKVLDVYNEYLQKITEKIKSSQKTILVAAPGPFYLLTQKFIEQIFIKQKITNDKRFILKFACLELFYEYFLSLQQSEDNDNLIKDKIKKTIDILIDLMSEFFLQQLELGDKILQIMINIIDNDKKSDNYTLSVFNTGNKHEIIRAFAYNNFSFNNQLYYKCQDFMQKYFPQHYDMTDYVD